MGFLYHEYIDKYVAGAKRRNRTEKRARNYKFVVISTQGYEYPFKTREATMNKLRKLGKGSLSITR